MENFYVYLLLDPTNSYLPFYIGKGSGNRWKNHLTESLDRTANKRKHYKIQKIRNAGFEPKVMFWEKNMPEIEAYDLEEMLIVRFGRSKIDDFGILTNICLQARPPGFLGCCDQELFRKKISESCSGKKNGFYGKKHAPSSLVKIGDANRGKTLSDSQKQKISKTLIGRIVSDDTREKMSEAQKGKSKSVEHRAKIGDFHRGKIISEEQRAKISASSKGRKHSPETIEKMKSAALLREAKKRDIRDGWKK